MRPRMQITLWCHDRVPGTRLFCHKMSLEWNSLACPISMWYISTFYASGQILSFVTQFKYLGHVIRNDLCDDKDIKRGIKATYSQGAIYFLVDLRDVRVLSRLFHDYFRRTPCVFLVQHCGLYLHLWLYKCLYRVLTNVWNVSMGMPSMIVAHTMFANLGIANAWNSVLLINQAMALS